MARMTLYSERMVSMSSSLATWKMEILLTYLDGMAVRGVLVCLGGGK